MNQKVSAPDKIMGFLTNSVTFYPSGDLLQTEKYGAVTLSKTIQNIL